jgi:hypothetical protein
MIATEMGYIYLHDSHIGNTLSAVTAAPASRPILLVPQVIEARVASLELDIEPLGLYACSLLAVWVCTMYSGSILSSCYHYRLAPTSST